MSKIPISTINTRLHARSNPVEGGTTAGVVSAETEGGEGGEVTLEALRAQIEELRAEKAAREEADARKVREDQEEAEKLLELGRVRDAQAEVEELKAERARDEASRKGALVGSVKGEGSVNSFGSLSSSNPFRMRQESLRRDEELRQYAESTGQVLVTRDSQRRSASPFPVGSSIGIGSIGAVGQHLLKAIKKLGRPVRGDSEEFRGWKDGWMSFLQAMSWTEHLSSAPEVVDLFSFGEVDKGILALLRSTLQPSESQRITSAKVVRDAWATLEKAHQPVDSNSRSDAMAVLSSMKLENAFSLDSHLETFMRRVSHLNSESVPSRDHIPTTLVVGTLFGTLPKNSYNATLRQSLKAQHPRSLSLKTVVEALLDEPDQVVAGVTLASDPRSDLSESETRLLILGVHPGEALPCSNCAGTNHTWSGCFSEGGGNVGGQVDFRKRTGRGGTGASARTEEKINQRFPDSKNFFFVANITVDVSKTARQAGQPTQTFWDSGAGVHGWGPQADFWDFEVSKTPDVVRQADGKMLPITGYGTIKLKTVVEGCVEIIYLVNVAHIPSLGNLSLISVPTITKTKGTQCIAVGDKHDLYRDGVLLIEGKNETGLYRAMVEVVRQEAATK